MKYEIFGPFAVPVENRVIAGKEERKKFWKDVDEAHKKLSQATGCYIFSIKASKGAMPWYVGQTRKQNFESQCFNGKKLLDLTRKLAGRRGTLHLHLVANMTNGGNFKKSAENNGDLERLLIQFASMANYNLLNTHHNTFLKNLEVPGLINSGKGKLPLSVRSLKVVLNIKNALSVK